jgi:diguanylate cyclase (GGDEF)-like protein
MAEAQDLLLFAVELQKAIPADPGKPQAWMTMAGDLYRECMEGGEIRRVFSSAMDMRDRGEFRRSAETLHTLSTSYGGGKEATARAALAKIIEILKSASAKPTERGAWRRFPREQLDDLLPIARKKVFEEELPQAIAQASEEEPLALIATDIDHFKAVNDTHGHPAADEVLKSVGAIHELVCRGRAKAYRFGGEELVILAPNTTADEARALAERIRALVEACVVPAIGGAVTVSAGVAATTDPQCSTLHTHADGALYDAKHAGRNRVVVHGTSPSSALAVAPPAPLVRADEHPSGDARPAGCPADIPADVFAGIRKKCEAEWPDDFRMRLYCETTQFDAYRSLNKPTATESGLTPEATAILRAAAETGEIVILETDQSGKWIRAGQDDFLDHSDPALAARHLDGLALLLKRGLARHDSEQLFMLTGAGFQQGRAPQH